MSLTEAANGISDLLPGAVFLQIKPEVPDFTTGQPCQLLMHGSSTVTLTFTPDNALEVLGLLTCSIFSETKLLLTWNLKSLISYFKFYVGLPKITTSVLDLQVIENFLGIKKKCPENLLECIDRLKGYKSNWKRLYQNLHLPLLLKVLPEIETTPLLLDSTSKYAFYEIEGQHNGRLRSYKAFSKGFIPHTLNESQKNSLIPKGYDKLIISFDIRHCEASVLQWLSKDLVLGNIISSGNDLYKEIYKLITNNTCDSDKKRTMTKALFLPVMYGCGANTLAENLSISIEVARELIARIDVIFPTVSKWLRDVQEQAGSISDYFGRPRTYAPEKAYQARNFVVQSVAATVCLEKLVEVSKVAKVCFSIHDEYGIISTPKTAANDYKIVKEILETESKLAPGLKFKCHGKVIKLIMPKNEVDINLI